MGTERKKEKKHCFLRFSAQENKITASTLYFANLTSISHFYNNKQAGRWVGMQARTEPREQNPAVKEGRAEGGKTKNKTGLLSSPVGNTNKS